VWQDAETCSIKKSKNFIEVHPAPALWTSKNCFTQLVDSVDFHPIAMSNFELVGTQVDSARKHAKWQSDGSQQAGSLQTKQNVQLCLQENHPSAIRMTSLLECSTV
jgi:hypothetical protein